MKLGRFTYPDVSLKDSIADTRKIYDRFRDEEVDSKLVSETIGYRGGSFTHHLSSLRKYALVTPRGKIRVTDLGKRITYPASKEAELDAIEEALINVELFKILYGKYGLELPKAKFWVNLSNITGAEAPDAQAREGVIRQIYVDSVSPLASRVKEGKAELSSRFEVGAIKLPEDFFTFETDDIKIQIRKDIETFEFVKTRLMETLKPLLEFEEKRMQQIMRGD